MDPSADSLSGEQQKTCGSASDRVSMRRIFHESCWNDTGTVVCNMNPGRSDRQTHLSPRSQPNTMSRPRALTIPVMIRTGFCFSHAAMQDIVMRIEDLGENAIDSRHLSTGQTHLSFPHIGVFRLVEMDTEQ